MQVVELLDPSLEVVREVSQSALVRELRDLICESAKVICLLDQECRAAYFRSCASSLHAGCAAADNYNVAWLVDFKLLIFFSLDDCRVNSASDRSVVLDTVAGASDVAADAFSDVALFTEFCLVHPVRVSDKASADTDEVSIASLEDVVSYFRASDVAHGDYRLAESFFYSFCEICSPSVRIAVAVDLILQRRVESCRYVVNVYFVSEVLQILKTVVEVVAALEELVCTDSGKERYRTEPELRPVDPLRGSIINNKSP